MIVGEESLESLTTSAFSDEDLATVLSMLDQYNGRESERVRRAVLTLSRGDVGKLLHHIGVAQQDYRNVLWWSGSQT